MNRTQRRNDLAIMADIVRVARERGGARRTHIVYGANLNFRIVKGYLERMLRSGLLVFRDPRYFATGKADAFVDQCEAIHRSLLAEDPAADIRRRFHEPL